MASIAIADVQNVEHLPIDSQDLCTKVTLVVAGRPSGEEPGRIVASSTASTEEFLTYYPLPVVHEYEDAAHATYGAHKTLALPEAINPFLPPTDTLIPDPLIVNLGAGGSSSAAVLRDGDLETGQQIVFGGGSEHFQLAYSWHQAATARQFVGWRLMYSLEEFTTSGMGELWKRNVHARRQDINGNNSTVTWGLPETTSGASDISDAWATAHLDARQAVSNSEYTINSLALEVRSWSGAPWSGRLYVTHFYPLVLDTGYLDSIAKANIRLPAVTPQRVTVAGYVQPDRAHTIVGWPGGDYTADAAQHQYELGRTVIDFEQRGAPVGMENQDVEAVRTARKRESDARSSALYPVRMLGR